MGCASGSGGGTVGDKVGEGDERDTRESSPQPGRRQETEAKETGVKATGAKAPGAQDSQETGGKG